MKVKIKGIRDLIEAIYVFDAGRLVGVADAAEAESGMANTYPMELVEEIFDD